MIFELQSMHTCVKFMHNYSVDPHTLNSDNFESHSHESGDVFVSMFLRSSGGVRVCEHTKNGKENAK